MIVKFDDGHVDGRAQAGNESNAEGKETSGPSLTTLVHELKDHVLVELRL